MRARSLVPIGRVACVVVSALLCTATMQRCATAAVKAFASDGEATVYVDAPFRGTFSVVADASLRVQKRNAAWSLVDMSLLGDAPPSDGVSIGLFPVAGGAHVFTSVVQRGRTTFRDTGFACSSRCRIGLHGSRTSIVATFHGRIVGIWSRGAFRMRRPAMQLNGEVSARGDRLDAVLVPRPSIAGGRPVAVARCAFTTQGVDVYREGGTLHFAGTFTRREASYFSLTTRLHGDTCASVGDAPIYR